MPLFYLYYHPSLWNGNACLLATWSILGSPRAPTVPLWRSSCRLTPFLQIFPGGGRFALLDHESDGIYKSTGSQRSTVGSNPQCVQLIFTSWRQFITSLELSSLEAPLGSVEMWSAWDGFQVDIRHLQERWLDLEQNTLGLETPSIFCHFQIDTCSTDNLLMNHILQFIIIISALALLKFHHFRAGVWEKIS